MKHYVYTLSDQGIPFYVGMGSGDRAYSHEKYAVGEASLGYGIKNDYNPHKTRKIQKVLREGRSIEYDFIKNLSFNDAQTIEKRLIKKYGRYSGPEKGILTNMTLGGTGGNTYVCLSEKKKQQRNKKLSKSLKATYAEYGKEIMDKIYKIKEHNGTLNNTWRDKPAHQKHCRLLCEKQKIKIQQLDHGNILRTWDSFAEAGESIPNTSQGSITNACDKYRKDGKPRLAGGFQWKKC